MTFVRAISQNSQSNLKVVLSKVTLEPPFSFVYSRSNPSTKNQNQESITVTDISDYQWSTITSQEGTFRVTAVSDRYCGYPRRIQSQKGANVILTEE
jgi:nucleoporin POM152